MYAYISDSFFYSWDTFSTYWFALSRLQMGAFVLFYYILICFVCFLSLGELLFLRRKSRREGVVDLEKMGDWRNWEECTERKLWLICIIWQTTLFKMKNVYKEEKIKQGFVPYVPYTKTKRNVNYSWYKIKIMKHGILH